MTGYISIYVFMTRHEVHSTECVCSYYGLRVWEVHSTECVCSYYGPDTKSIVQSVCVHTMDFVSGHKQIN